MPIRNVKFPKQNLFNIENNALNIGDVNLLYGYYPSDKIDFYNLLIDVYKRPILPFNRKKEAMVKELRDSHFTRLFKKDYAFLTHIQSMMFPNTTAPILYIPSYDFGLNESIIPDIILYFKEWNRITYQAIILDAYNTTAKKFLSENDAIIEISLSDGLSMIRNGKVNNE